MGLPKIIFDLKDINDHKVFAKKLVPDLELYKAEFKKNMDIVRKIDKNIKTIYTKEA